jgi:hypothetical protein
MPKLIQDIHKLISSYKTHDTVIKTYHLIWAKQKAFFKIPLAKPIRLVLSKRKIYFKQFLVLVMIRRIPEGPLDG